MKNPDQQDDVDRLLAWLDRFLTTYEAVLRAAYRIAVLVLLCLVLFEMRDHRPYSPDIRQLETDVDRIERNVEKLRQRLAP